MNETKILKFHATWCNPCKALSKVLEEVDMKMPVEAVDVDQFQDKVKEFQIRSVPTLVALVDGKEVSRISGSQTAAQLNMWRASF